MPYEIIQVGDFNCDILWCLHNDAGYCEADEDIINLSPNQNKCTMYEFNEKAEYIVNDDLELQNIIDEYESLGIDCKEIEVSDRLILKTINKKSTLFKISREGEKEYYFFPSIEGGVGYIHKSIRKADLFNEAG